MTKENATNKEKDLLDKENAKDWGHLNHIIETYSAKSIAECIAYSTHSKTKSVAISNELNNYNAGIKRIR